MFFFLVAFTFFISSYKLAFYKFSVDLLMLASYSLVFGRFLSLSGGHSSPPSLFSVRSDAASTTSPTHHFPPAPLGPHSQILLCPPFTWGPGPPSNTHPILSRPLLLRHYPAADIRQRAHTDSCTFSPVLNQLDQTTSQKEKTILCFLSCS